MMRGKDLERITISNYDVSIHLDVPL